MLPWTVMVDDEDATTLPAFCRVGAMSWALKTVWKLVFVPLNAVVCEFAILPEIFCNANDWADSPDTALLSASNIPITRSPVGRGDDQQCRRPQCRYPLSQVPCQIKIDVDSVY